MTLSLKTIPPLFLAFLSAFIASLFSTQIISSEYIGSLWDAAHYLSIATEGYENFQLAFFPGFPLFAKMLGSNVILICIANALLFVVSMGWLYEHFKVNIKYRYLLSLLPSFLFMFLPYSEALFFAIATIFIIAYDRNQLLWAALALVVCGVVRPTATVFIPALILAEWMVSGRAFEWKRTFVYVFACVAGLTLAFGIQYAMSGEWFAFFEAQKLWENELRWPELPLRSWESKAVVMLDSAALWLSLIAGLYLLFRIKNSPYNSSDRAYSFSLAYLAGTALLILFFRGGSLFSLNRFIFASPFGLLAIYKLLQSPFHVKRVWMSIVGLLLFYLLFDSFVHIQTQLKYSAVALFLTVPLFFNHSNRSISNLSYGVCVLCMFILQIFFMWKCLEGHWVG